MRAISPYERAAKDADGSTSLGADSDLDHTSVVRRRSIAFSLVASIMVQALNVVSGVILARVLGPGDRGELAAVMLWPSVLALVGSCGLPEALTYHVARTTASASELIATGLVMAIVQSALTMAVGAALVPLVLMRQSHDAIAAALLFLLFIPLNYVSLVFMSVLNGQQSFGRFNFCRLLVIAATVGLLALLALAGALTTASAVGAYLVANFVTAVAAGVLVAHGTRLGLRPSGSVAMLLLRYGLQNHLGAVSSAFNERLDQLVMSIFLAPARLGIYVVALTLAAPTSLIGNSISLVALPNVARVRQSLRRAELARGMVSLTLALSIATSAILIALAPHLLALIFGTAYAEAGDVARVLMIAVAVLSTGRVLGATLRAVGRPLDVSVAELVALAVTVVSLAILLPIVGILGAAVASLLAYMASAAWMAHRAALALNLPVQELMLLRRADIEQFAATALRSAAALFGRRERDREEPRRSG